MRSPFWKGIGIRPLLALKAFVAASTQGQHIVIFTFITCFLIPTSCFGKAELNYRLSIDALVPFKRSFVRGYILMSKIPET